MIFVAETGIAVVRILVAFYGFWLVWRVMLPVLPGPEGARERIAPYARYFTDPWVGPVVRLLRIPARAVSWDCSSASLRRRSLWADWRRRSDRRSGMRALIDP